MAPRKIRCGICRSPTKLTRGPKLFLRRYIVEDVKSYMCQKCGMGYTPLQEYERVRLKIATIENRVKKPALAGVKYLVL